VIETQFSLRPIHLITGSYTDLASLAIVINVVTGDDVSPDSEMLRTNVLLSHAGLYKYCLINVQFVARYGQ
jgi:hypothetical protein